MAEESVYQKELQERNAAIASVVLRWIGSHGLGIACDGTDYFVHSTGKKSGVLKADQQVRCDSRESAYWAAITLIEAEIRHGENR